MAEHTPEVLVISKPLVPPWDDGGKGVVRELVAHGREFKYRVPTVAGAEVPWPRAEGWPAFGDGAGYAPTLSAKAKLFTRLLTVRAAEIRHFFFAPNWASSMGSRMVTWLRSGPTVQTVCSAPKSYDGVARLLFGQKIVVLSDHTRKGLIDAGVPEDRIRLIPPGVEIPEPVSPDRMTEVRKRHGLGEAPTVLYAGDYDFSKAARTVLTAAFRICQENDDIRFLFAGRIKNPASSDEEQRLKALTAEANLGNRITFANYIEDFTDLLSAVDLTVLPAESVYAKVDLPLTLLEAMARKTPIVVADSGPLPELLVDDLGVKVRPKDPEQLASVVTELVAAPERLAAMGERAREAVRHRFSSERMAASHEDLYRELLAEP